ncbi:MAG: mono/diheme cytochrome c family protein [Arcticibacterium sp.]|jgi:mono/diheme cytochrome c family protein
MKKILLMFTAALFLGSCGEKKEKEESGFQMNRTKKEVSSKKVAVEIPVDLSNKGIGPVKNITISESLDSDMVSLGQEIFEVKCTACHMPNQRMIGPALAGILERRSPEWVMNMIINPTEMIQKDPIAKALLLEYNNAIMLNQNVNQEDSRAILEYLRSL